MGVHLILPLLSRTPDRGNMCDHWHLGGLGRGVSHNRGNRGGRSWLRVG